MDDPEEVKSVVPDVLYISDPKTNDKSKSTTSKDDESTEPKPGGKVKVC